MTDFDWFALSPLDSWMFRDGRPFNQDDSGAAEARGIFPPWPPTVVGAMRAAILKGPLGGNWEKEKLGDGTNWQKGGTLGPLQFGPLVVLDEGAPIFPAPLNMLRASDGALGLLSPGPPLACDLGAEVRLPVPTPPLEGAKAFEGAWITARGMEAILAGNLPDSEDIRMQDEVASRETRVGIAIDPGTRRVRDGALYMASHIRPKPGISLALSVSGLAEEDRPGGLIAFGGEHRMGEVRLREAVALPSGSAPKAGRRIAVALSPVVLDPFPGPGGELGDLGRVVSACLGRPARIGGWDSQNRTALPLKLAAPAGSVWFLECDEGDARRGLAAIGEATQWGFGAVALGKWEDCHGKGE